MKAYIVYRDKSDHARTVIDFLREFERRTGRQPDLIDPDTREGVAFCRNYDIMQYPSVVATDNDGVMQQVWAGLPLPTINEVSYYVQ